MITDKITATNEVNAFINELQPKAVADLAPFLGQKIVNKDGSVVQKIRNLSLQQTWCSSGIEARLFSNGIESRLFITGPTHGDIRFSITKKYNKHYDSINKTLYIGRIVDGILTLFYPFKPLKTDYNISELIQKSVKIREASNIVSDLTQEIIEFESNISLLADLGKNQR